jgi:hypothetical protein
LTRDLISGIEQGEKKTVRETYFACLVDETLQQKAVRRIQIFASI